MRITFLVLLASSFTLAACSTAEQAESSATAASTLSGSTGGTGTSGPTGMTDATGTVTGGEPTSGQGTTSDGTTLATSPGTESGTISTGTSSASTTGTTSDDTTTGTTGTTGTTDTTGTTTEGTTGGMSGGACEVDADCKLHDDCCSCYAIPVDQNDGSCEKLCDESKCSEIGVDKAVCRFGQCTLEKLDCSSEVACDSLPPDCPKGTLPGIEGACWSGKCVPAEACDKVPDCALCPDSMMCVEFQAWTVDRTCEPIPAKCQGDPSCACAGAEACVEPYGTCNEGMGEADLACICIAC